MARVLVAEDDPSLAQLVRLTLEDAGHDVVVTEDGRFALEALSAVAFDIVVLDLMMPWADGFDVLRNLEPPKPRVVILTARTDDYTRRRVDEFGVDAYVTKPYDPDELAAIVDRLTS